MAPGIAAPHNSGSFALPIFNQREKTRPYDRSHLVTVSSKGKSFRPLSSAIKDQSFTSPAHSGLWSRKPMNSRVNGHGSRGSMDCVKNSGRMDGQ